jgi:hypothetical protein
MNIVGPPWMYIVVLSSDTAGVVSTADPEPMVREQMMLPS